MGDQTITYYPCPKCKGEVEECDQPSSLLFFARCGSCGWIDDEDYYEGEGNTILLLSKEEAKKRGLLKDTLYYE